MPNQINSISKKAPQYDAGDMHDMASLAECDMDWMNTALSDVKIRVAQVKEDLIKQNPNAEYCFHSLERVLEMYVYLADDRLEYHSREAERLKAEWEQLKGGTQ